MFSNLLAVNTTNLIASLNIMWQGMLAIFIVIAAIILVTTVLNRITNGKKK